MGKASSKKTREERAATAAWADPPPWSTRLLAVAAGLGVVVSAASTWVHHQVTSSNGAYTSFCNLGSTVNCDTVVTSRWGTLFGVPVSVWGIGFYLVLLLVALRAGAGASAERDRARADALALAVAGAAFSAYMALVSFAILKAVCLLCTGLYVVSLLALFAAWRLGAPLAESLVRLRERWALVRRRPLVSGALTAALVGVLVASNYLSAGTRLTRAQVFQSNRQFYEWYTSQPIVDEPVDGGIASGPEKAPIQLVEFSDFECPHCAQAYVTLKDVLPRFHDEVRFVFHHFPLSSDCNEALPQKGHEHACDAARAAECANEQGRFRPFASLLFANQTTLDAKMIRGYAKEVGVDLAAFDKCLASGAPGERVQADVKAAQRVGVRSTPTFFINGRRIEGNMTFENWLLAFSVELDRS